MGLRRKGEGDIQDGGERVKLRRRVKEKLRRK